MRFSVWLDLHVDYNIRAFTGTGQVGLGDKAIHDLEGIAADG